MAPEGHGGEPQGEPPRTLQSISLESAYTDTSEPPPVKSPEQNANFLSKATHWWMGNLVVWGYKHALEQEDLPPLPDSDDPPALGQHFTRVWEAERKEAEPSLTRAVFSASRRRLIAGACLAFTVTALGFLPNILLNIILLYIEGRPTNNFMFRIFGRNYGYYAAAGMLVVTMLKTTFDNTLQHTMFRLQVHVKTQLVETVYKKSLVLSNSARQTKSVGEIVTLMQVDTDKVASTAPFIHMSWTGLMQILGTTGLLVYYIGWSALVGVAMLLVTIPLQGRLVNFLMELQRKVLVATSKRVKVINEVLQGVKVVKAYAWEKPFQQEVTNIRNTEVEALKTRVYLRAFQIAFMLTTPVLIMVVTFTSYTQLAKRELSAAAVFTAMSLFTALRGPLIFYPMVINSILAGHVSLIRLGRFLALPELVPVERKDEGGMDGGANGNAKAPVIEVTGGSFQWEAQAADVKAAAAPKKKRGALNWVLMGKERTGGNEEVAPPAGSAVKPTESPQKPFGLQNVNVSVMRGQLVAVVGPVGSGKSSLGAALLGEMNQVAGNRVTVNGSVAFCSQQAWIMNATLRDNILFGRPYHESRYQDVLKACALEADLAALPNGDGTEIGERGINLSGGQKQRVSLARAVYADTDIYILDDPLSAVDAHVGAHLFHQCIDGVLQGKTRVFITNQLQFVPMVDWVVVLRDGAVVEQGTYEEVMATEGEFSQLMKDHGSHTESKRVPSSSNLMAMNRLASVNRLAKLSEDKHTRLGTKAASIKEGGAVGLKKRKKTSLAVSKSGRLVEQEHRSKGGLKFSVYKRYWTETSILGPVVMLSLFGLVTALDAFNRYWLAYWTRNQFNQPTGFYLGIYAGLALAYAFFVFVRSVIQYVIGLITATRLHARCLDSILHAPMSFFDTTPVGRILNRFSSDQSTVDDVLVMSWSMCLNMSFSLAGTFIVICIVTPWFALAFLPISVMYVIIQNYYRRTARELKRLDSISKSPVYQQFTETLNGLSTIRAYQQEPRFLHLCDGKLDANNRAFFYLMCCNRWLAFRLETLGNILVFAASMLAVVNRANLYAGYAGISIDYALQISFALSMLIRNITDTENQMNSVERMYEYTDEIDHEAPRVIDTYRAPANWPAQGAIVIQDVSMRYRPNLPLVLKGVSLTIGGGEKVGVVGRTGSGKSSLMLCLFRLVEPAGGSITIDGLNISNMGLEDLRSRLAIIPQDPVLFSGTVRSNLDPFDAHPDADIWQALERAHLKERVSNLPNKLTADVVEYGENFSVGERQLLCLARVLLRNSKILVMDEATSSVDYETDRLIQATIRSDFKQTTMLIIAHRINTIIDATRVLVLSDGEVAEYDKPAALLEKPDGKFASLVQDTGPETAEHLNRVARGEADFFSSYQRTARASMKEDEPAGDEAK